MTFKVRVEKDKTVIESDNPSDHVLHYMLRGSYGIELLSAMKFTGINEIEVNAREVDLYDLKKEFDRKYKEKTGEKYFSLW